MLAIGGVLTSVMPPAQFGETDPFRPPDPSRLLLPGSSLDRVVDLECPLEALAFGPQGLEFGRDLAVCQPLAFPG